MSHRLTKKLTSVFMIVGVLLLIPTTISLGQPQANSTKDNLLQWLPAITFLFALATGVLNLYIVNKISATKEEILRIVRTEFKEEFSVIEKKVATKEQLEAFGREFKLLLENMQLKMRSGSADNT